MTTRARRGTRSRDTRLAGPCNVMGVDHGRQPGAGLKRSSVRSIYQRANRVGGGDRRVRRAARPLAGGVHRAPAAGRVARMAHPRQRDPGQVDRDSDHRRDAARGRLRDDRQVDRHVRGGHQPRRGRRADRPPRTAHDPRADRGHPQVPDARCRCARDRVHGDQTRVPGGERADDRPFEHRRAHQRPRGPPGRDGRDAPRDRPLVALDLPTPRPADHRRTGSRTSST